MIEYPFPWKFDAKNYSPLYLMGQVTEATVQSDIIALANIYSVDMVPIDAGGRRQRGRMMGAASAAGIDLAGIQNVKTGAAIPSGFADLEATLAPSGRALYIEVKAPSWLDRNNKLLRRAGQPSEEQLQFLLSKHERGAAVLVAWSAADVQNLLAAELVNNRRALS